MKRLCFLFIILFSGAALASEGSGRFFFEGDGIVGLHNPQNGLGETIHYRLPDGSYSESARLKIDQLFGLKESDPVEHISLRLIALLDFIQDRFGKAEKSIQLKSAYRSPAYNKDLHDQGKIVAKASTHMEGMAADIIISGVDGKYLWETLREKNCCGVGWYGGDSIHVDTGPARFWTAATSKVDTDISEHNKKILLRTDRDVYLKEESIDLFIARITEYPIGVNHEFRLVSMDKSGKERTVKEFWPVFANITNKDEDNCITIQKREEGRRIRLKLPKNIKSHSKSPLHIRIDFCQKPHKDMPDFILSNPIEISR